MYSLYIYLPLITVIITFFFSRFMGKFVVASMHLISLFLSLCISMFCLFEVIIKNVTSEIILFTWLNLFSFKLSIGFLFDPLSLSLSVIVLSISFFVHIFSIDYMWNDPYFTKFFTFLTLFTIFMLTLIVSPNFVQFFIGWEGVGVASYLLINFWYTRPEANRSAMKAIFLNKLGDSALYIAIILLFLIFKSFDFYTINFLVNNTALSSKFIFNNHPFLIDFICVLLFIACVGKSAQLGLHIWLPDAMEGPTPVSALLHAATMVTAGVYLLLRCSFIIESSLITLFLMTWVGLLTLFTVSIISIGQNDLKKIIAYSTCSHLGYMVAICGSSSYNIALFHLFNHAFFKALLFIAAGSLIHITAVQDIRFFGHLRFIAPFTYIAFVVGTLSSISLPGTSGFYSKDLLIEHIVLSTKYTEVSNGIFEFMILSSVILSFFYSFKLFFLLFYYTGENHICNENFYLNFLKRKTDKIFVNTPEEFFSIKKIKKESSYFTVLPLFFLSILSLVSGFSFINIFSNICLFQNQLYVNEKLFLFDSEILYNGTIINLPFLFMILSFLVSIFLLSFSEYIKKKSSFFILFNFIKKNFIYLRVYTYLENFQYNKFFFNLILIYSAINIFMGLSYNFFFKIFDRAFVEILSPLGLVRSLNNFFQNINVFQTGVLQYYIFSIYFMFILFFCILFSIFFCFLELFIIQSFLIFLFILSKPIKKNASLYI